MLGDIVQGERGITVLVSLAESVLVIENVLAIMRKGVLALLFCCSCELCMASVSSARAE